MAFIDRANVNGADDYKLAASKGLKHAYFKLTDGVNFVDATEPGRVAASRAAGVVVGVYHYAERNDPVAEAEFFLSKVGKPHPGDLRPALDLESAESKEWAEAFVEHCHKVLGFWPVLYGNTSFVGPLRASSAILRNCPWWRAEYGVNDGTRHPLEGGTQGATLHQYTSVGSFPGIDGHTDLNVYVANPAGLFVPRKHALSRLPSDAWVWAKWYLGLGQFRGHRRDFRVRPNVPKRIPAGWWRAVAWFAKHLPQR